MALMETSSTKRLDLLSWISPFEGVDTNANTRFTLSVL